MEHDGSVTLTPPPPSLKRLADILFLHKLDTFTQAEAITAGPQQYGNVNIGQVFIVSEGTVPTLLPPRPLSASLRLICDSSK